MFIPDRKVGDFFENFAPKSEIIAVLVIHTPPIFQFAYIVILKK